MDGLSFPRAASLDVRGARIHPHLFACQKLVSLPSYAPRSARMQRFAVGDFVFKASAAPLPDGAPAADVRTWQAKEWHGGVVQDVEGHASRVTLTVKWNGVRTTTKEDATTVRDSLPTPQTLTRPPSPAPGGDDEDDDDLDLNDSNPRDLDNDDNPPPSLSEDSESSSDDESDSSSDDELPPIVGVARQGKVKIGRTEVTYVLVLPMRAYPYLCTACMELSLRILPLETVCAPRTRPFSGCVLACFASPQ